MSHWIQRGIALFCTDLEKNELTQIYAARSQGDPPRMLGGHFGTARDTGGGSAVRDSARRRLVVDSDNGGGEDRVVGNGSRAGGTVAQDSSGRFR